MAIALSDATLAALPPGIAVPAYDRATVRPGIAHLGVGNFHRAHMALYVDRCLHRQDQSGWGILGIGVVDDERERAKAALFPAQRGLYTLAQCPPQGDPDRRVVGSIVDYLHAPADPAAAIARLADPAIRIVSMTITEGGYKSGTPAIAHDLANPEAPRSVFGLVAAAIARRRRDGTAPFTILSCDNLQHNGSVARAAFAEFARALDPDLAAYIDAEIDFPSCMVDRITPAVTPDDQHRLNAGSGVDDGWPLFSEDFLQWVIEDRFRNGRPALDDVGVQFTGDVAPYEQVKLRLLNASHSMLAYPAALAGYRLVHEAMANPHLHRLLQTFMTADAMPHLAAPAGLTLADYRDAVLRRFTNPNIADQILRLCSDGAAKLPVFIWPTLRETLAQGGDASRLAFVLACYVNHLGGRDDSGAGFAPAEPNLTEEDHRLAASPDDADGLRLSPFREWQLDDHPAFAGRFAQMRTAIRTQGALQIAAGLV